MTTLHEQGAREAFMRALRKPDGAGLVAAGLTAVHDGLLDDELLDTVGQMHRTSSQAWPAEQMFMAALAHARICNGEILRLKVRAAGTPHGDDFRKENARDLADLPEPFAAVVDMTQNLADSDGTLSWSAPVVASVCTEATKPGPDGRPVNVQQEVVVSAGQVPLEIGSTMPSRTMLHLAEAGGVARWPYGRDWVHVWLARDRWRDRVSVSPDR